MTFTLTPLDVARAWGVDDESSTFEGKRSPIRIIEQNRDNFVTYWTALAKMGEEGVNRFMEAFFQTYGVTFIRAYIHCYMKMRFLRIHNWRYFLGRMAVLPCFAEFVRESPQIASDLFAFEVKLAAATMPPYTDVTKTVSGPLLDQKFRFTTFPSLSCLFHIIIASASTPDPCRILFPPTLTLQLQAVSHLTPRLDKYAKGCSELRETDKCEKDFFKMAGEVSAVLKRERSPEDVARWCEHDDAVNLDKFAIFRYSDGMTLQVCVHCQSVQFPRRTVS